jgi:hypothetical protein
VPHANPAAPQRIEFTQPYKEEFDRLLAAMAEAEKAFKDAQVEYERCERALIRHIESRHYINAFA